MPNLNMAAQRTGKNVRTVDAAETVASETHPDGPGHLQIPPVSRNHHGENPSAWQNENCCLLWSSRGISADIGLWSRLMDTTEDQEIYR